MISASTTPLARIGDKFYEKLEDAINAVGENDTIILVSNVILDDTLMINKIVNINLNGNTISANEKVFHVKKGTLNISGKGTIKETKPKYGAIMLTGSSDQNDEKYSVKVEKIQ